MTGPVLWSDLQIPGQPPVPLSEDQWDANFAGFDGRLRPIEDLRYSVPGLGELSVVSGGQAVSVPLTDGTGADQHNLPLAQFQPQGAWATGTAYARGDLVTVGNVSAVATADHQSTTYAADLKAGLWTPNSPSADWITERGVYDPTVQYSIGDSILYTSDGGLRWGLWRGSASDDPNRVIPVGSAPGSDDPTGAPYWSAETILPRARQLSMRSKGGGFASPDIAAGATVAARRLALPISIPLAWANSGGAIQPRNTSRVNVVFELRLDGVRVATLTIPPGQDHALLVGAGAIAVQPGSMFKLVNTGAALKATAVSVGIAGYHV